MFHEKRCSLNLEQEGRPLAQPQDDTVAGGLSSAMVPFKPGKSSWVEVYEAR